MDPLKRGMSEAAEAAEAGKQSPVSGSLHAIDAQIQNKIGLLESLLGSCDGVLSRHDREGRAAAEEAAAEHPEPEDAPAHRSHPGNPVGPVQLQGHRASTPRKEVHHSAPHDAIVSLQAGRENAPERSRRAQREASVPSIAHLIEATCLLRTQRVLCNVTRQMCSVHHIHCTVASLRIHQLAERKIRNMASVENR